MAFACALALTGVAGLQGCSRGPGESAPASDQAEAALIPRADLFGDPQRAGAQLSPRGDMVAFLAPRDGAMNLWVAPLDTLGEARALTQEQGLGVRQFAWAYDGRTLLYVNRGPEPNAQRLYALEVESGEARALTPAGAHAELVNLSPRDPLGVIAAVNDRDAAWPDLVRLDLSDGSRTVLHRDVPAYGAPRFASYVVDMDNTLRLGIDAKADGGSDIYKRDSEGRWSLLFSIAFEDSLSSSVIGFEAGGQTFLMLDSSGRDRAALVRVDAETGAKTVLGESPRADVIDVWLDPATHQPEAYAAEYLRRDWRALDAEAQADLDFLDQRLQGEPIIASRSADDHRWIVVEDDPVAPARSYLYDRSDPSNRRLTLLFRHRPALEGQQLQPMIPVEIESRDALTLVSYMTLPPGADRNNDTLPDRPVPLVIVPHDGPWTRDSYGFNTLHQWLANRGYAALSVNYRGSTGLGKAFLNQGNREWGGAMQDDLLVAARWAIERGVAPPDRIAILGEGYGGYAALSGLAATPDQFACGVAINPPLSLVGLADSLPPNANAARAQVLARVGDPRIPEQREMLRQRSPMTRADALTRPIFIAQGAPTATASRADAEALMRVMRARGLDGLHIVFPTERGAILGTPDRLALFASIEHFLGHCLGGRVEPTGAAFEGVDMQVFEGADLAPGLAAFARRAAAPAASSAGAEPEPKPASFEQGDEEAEPLSLALPPPPAALETAPSIP